MRKMVDGSLGSECDITMCQRVIERMATVWHKLGRDGKRDLKYLITPIAGGSTCTCLSACWPCKKQKDTGSAEWLSGQVCLG
jgi:hypothetical protein